MLRRFPQAYTAFETDRETSRWAFDRMRQELTDLKPGGFLMAQQVSYMSSSARRLGLGAIFARPAEYL